MSSRARNSTPRARSTVVRAVRGAVVGCASAAIACGVRAQSGQAAESLIHVVRHAAPKWVEADRRSLRDEQTPSPGFRARLLQDETAQSSYVAWPVTAPSSDGSDPSVRAAEVVARRLARDGLLVTLAEAVAKWREPGGKPSSTAFDEPKLDGLRGVGFPVDLLEYFALDGAPSTPLQVVRRAESRIDSGATIDAMRAELPQFGFRFQPSAPGFRVATESGEEEIGLVRVQLTSGDYWSEAGDGGSLDIVRQLLEALPDADFFASIEEKHLARFLETARGWPIARAGRWTVAVEPRPVAQWAQDNAKPGWIDGAAEDRKARDSRDRRDARDLETAHAPRESVALVPRYASRGETGPTFVPGETFLIEAFAFEGHRVVQSPLLFQGGNLLAVRDPSSGERILLLGEAEIYRNTALGLTRDQVLDAFRIEMGVDRCVVLPAVSFHIDCELTVRAVGRKLVAFVNDTPAAARIVLECGLGALETHGDIAGAAANDARAKLAARRTSEAVDIVSSALVPHLVGPGLFAESFAKTFSSAAWDSGAGNLQTFLLALDLLQSETAPNESSARDPNTAAYLESLRRREADRARLVKSLSDLGFEIVRVPSFSDGDRGINYVNGVQARGVYLMPAQGGFYAALDRAAEHAFESALGSDVKTIPLHTSESQRRSGAIHCSISVCGRT